MRTVGPSHEQVAYMTGVEVAKLNRSVVQLLQMPIYKLHAVLSGPSLHALGVLHHDKWAHCVREGYESQQKKPVPAHRFGPTRNGLVPREWT